MIRLESDGLEPLELEDFDAGILAYSLDLGWPVTRVVATDRPGADGTDDLTQFTGGRVVSAEIAVWGGTRGPRRLLLDRLAQFCQVRRRSVLTFDDGGQTRRVLIRADQGSAPMGTEDTSVVTVQWIGYTGVIESADVATVDVTPTLDPPGVPWPWTWPVEWLGGDEPPVGTPVVSAGTDRAWPTITIHGPCTGPRVSIGDRRLSFPGLVVADGDTIDIDTAARTAVLNGRLDRLSRLDFDASEWCPIEPGTNALRFSAAAWSTPARAVIAWRNAYVL